MHRDVRCSRFGLIPVVPLLFVTGAGCGGGHASPHGTGGTAGNSPSSAAVGSTSSGAASASSTSSTGSSSTGGGSAASSGNATSSAASGSSSSGGTPSPCTKGPALTAGMWTNITPAGVDFSSIYGANDIEIDPNDSCVLYACIDQTGLFKSTDAGGTWTRLGTPPAMPDYSSNVSFLDSPIRIAIDPADSTHLYATQGVRGTTLGFWESSDGGTTWARPPAFDTVAQATTTHDVTTLAIDPTDFKHVLLGSHSAWPNMTNAGVMETTDGGQTWIVHPPAAGWVSGSIGLGFLYDPASNTDTKTWLMSGDSGFWRTTDSGGTWTQVSTNGGTHGAAEVSRSSTGVLYTGAFVYPMRSTDNGVTWTQLSTLPYASYYVVIDDGKRLYTAPSFAAMASPENLPYSTSPESDGQTWTPYQGGAQIFGNGPYRARFDKANGLIYTANWDAGLWVLKVQ